MDEQRALLDSLMGLNRDGDRPDEAALEFTHARVCKPWLVGLCPRELFQDAGGCGLLHLPHLRTAYEESARTFGYERDLANELSTLLADVEKKIARGQKRLDEDGGDAQDRAQVLQLTQELQDVAQQAARAAQDGDADASLRLLDKTELLKRKRRELLRAGGAAVDVNQKLRVCDVCGAFLSIFDSDRRLADHFGGKVHVGYVQIRRKLEELVQKRTQEKTEKRRRSRSSGRREGRTRDRKRSRSRERRRERRSSYQRRRRSSSVSRSRSRSRSRDRKRSRRHRR